MKYNVKLDADNKNIDVSLSVKKEEGEGDFFENIGNIFNNVKLPDSLSNSLPDGATDVVDVD